MANITARAHMQNLISQGFPDDQHSLVERTIADLGISRSRAHDVWHSIAREKMIADNKGGLTLNQLKSKHDTNTRVRESIRRGLKTIVEQDDPREDEIVEEARFRSERCGDTVITGFRGIAEEAEFIDHQFRIGDKFFWTTKRMKPIALQEISKARDL